MDASTDLIAADRRLVATVDAELAVAVAAAGAHLACRPGCTACCRGPFPIPPLDAWRLGLGLADLARRDPVRAAAVADRARAAVTALAPDFPGDPATGLLVDDEARQERFCSDRIDLPCPALDPATGRCDLYASRPLACRTCGPPVRIGDEDLPPCHLCFATADPAEIAAARVEIDPAGLELELAERLEAGGAARGETLVAFALAMA